MTMTPAYYGIVHFMQKYGIPNGGRGKLELENVKRSSLEIPDPFPFENALKLDETFASCKTTNVLDILRRIELILSGYLERIWSELNEREKKVLARVPVIDCYEEVLFNCILHTYLESGTPVVQKAFWPNGKKFVVCLTHDVDEIKKRYQYITRSLRCIKSGDLRGLKNQLISLTRKIVLKEEPYWTFEKIIDLERRLNVRSTFYFLNESSEVKLLDRSTWRHYGRKYDITCGKVAEVIKRLHSEGWEIGLHGSFHSYNDINKLRYEKDVLERVLGAKVHGIRQHSLNLDIPNTWRIHTRIGLEYDTTLGFNDCVGFRWGTCFPFHPIDKETNRPMKLLEIPLIIEDIALFSYDDPWGVCVDVIDTVKKYGGVLTLLWHHSVFNELEYPGWAEIYKRIIKVCKEEDAWVTNAYEIAKWWKMREESELKCEYDGRTLKIKPYPRNQRHFIKVYLPKGNTLEVSSANAEVICEDENSVTISTMNLEERGEITLRIR